MASLRLSRRPDVPDGAHRNMSDADVERLLTLLRRGDNDSDTSTRLAIVNRVHALLPTCELRQQYHLYQLEIRFPSDSRNLLTLYR